MNLAEVKGHLPVLVLFGLLSACSAPEPPQQVETTPAKKPASSVAVTIAQMKFQPDTVRVHAGDTLVFTNKDVVEHDATALPDSAWTTGKLAPGQTGKVVVGKSTDYFCSIHVVMKGIVEVAP
jgi:plastocyanin